MRGGDCSSYMTASVDLVSVCADVAILLTLGATVAIPTFSPLARLVIATFALAFAWLAAAVLDATRSADWTILLAGAVIVVAVAVTTATLHRWTQEGADGDSGPGHRDTRGGGGPRSRRPDAPRGRGGDSAPSWWPEFERELALYAAEREMEFDRCTVGAMSDSAVSICANRWRPRCRRVAIVASRVRKARAASP